MERLAALAVEEVNAVLREPGETPVGEGARVRVGLPQDGVHLFDGESGEALHHPDRDDSNGLAAVGTPGSPDE